MSAPERIFVPEYSAGHRTGKACSWLMFALGVVLVVLKGGQDPGASLVAGFFLLCAVGLQVATIRRIRFADRMIVERSWLPPREIEYGDLVDVGVTSLKLRRGYLSLYGIRNGGELLQMIDEVSRDGWIAEGQIEGELIAQESLASAALVWSLLLATVCSVSLGFLWPAAAEVDGRLRFLGLFLAWFGPVYLVVKRWYPSPARAP